MVVRLDVVEIVVELTSLVEFEGGLGGAALVPLLVLVGSVLVLLVLPVVAGDFGPHCRGSLYPASFDATLGPRATAINKRNRGEAGLMLLRAARRGEVKKGNTFNSFKILKAHICGRTVPFLLVHDAVVCAPTWQLGRCRDVRCGVYLRATLAQVAFLRCVARSLVTDAWRWRCGGGRGSKPPSRRAIYPLLSPAVYSHGHGVPRPVSSAAHPTCSAGLVGPVRQTVPPCYTAARGPSAVAEELQPEEPSALSRPFYLDLQATTPTVSLPVPVPVPIPERALTRDRVAPGSPAPSHSATVLRCCTPPAPDRARDDGAGRCCGTQDPRVLDAMLPFSVGSYGNPHSRTHAYGWEAEDAMEQARAEVASLIGADAREIIWTSGATESNNMSIKGVGRFYK